MEVQEIESRERIQELVEKYGREEVRGSDEHIKEKRWGI